MSEETTNQEVEVKKSNLEIASAIVKEVHVAGNSELENEDVSIVALRDSGEFTFRQASKIYPRTLEVLGLKTSSKDRYTAAEGSLMEYFSETELENWDSVLRIAARVSAEIDDTDEKQALALVKKFAKKNELELPDRPKGSGGGGGNRGFRGEIFAYMIANPDADTSAIADFCKANGKDDAAVKRFSSIFEMAKAVRSA